MIVVPAPVNLIRSALAEDIIPSSPSSELVWINASVYLVALIVPADVVASLGPIQGILASEARVGVVAWTPGPAIVTLSAV